MSISNECEFLLEPKARAEIARVEIAVPPLLHAAHFITSRNKLVEF